MIEAWLINDTVSTAVQRTEGHQVTLFCCTARWLAFYVSQTFLYNEHERGRTLIYHGWLAGWLAWSVLPVLCPVTSVHMLHLWVSSPYVLIQLLWLVCRLVCDSICSWTLWRIIISEMVSCFEKGVCTEAGMYALRERRVHVTQEDFEMAVGKVGNLQNNLLHSIINQWANASCSRILAKRICCFTTLLHKLSVYQPIWLYGSQFLFQSSDDSG